MGYEFEDIVATYTTASWCKGKTRSGITKTCHTCHDTRRKVTPCGIRANECDTSAHVLPFTFELRADLLRDRVDCTRLVARRNISKGFRELVPQPALLRIGNFGEVFLNGEEVLVHTSPHAYAIRLV